MDVKTVDAARAEDREDRVDERRDRKDRPERLEAQIERHSGGGGR